MAPNFWNMAAGAYRVSTAHAFLAHGDGVRDYADTQKDVVPWPEATLVGAGFDLILQYDPANGITFPVASMKKLFAKEVMGQGDDKRSSQVASNPLLGAMMGNTAGGQ